MTSQNKLIIKEEPGEKSTETNKLLNEKELAEREKWYTSESNYNYLYPDLNDPLFNVKIAEKKRI